jgi:hypothetical protein
VVNPAQCNLPLNGAEIVIREPKAKGAEGGAQ